MQKLLILFLCGLSFCALAGHDEAKSAFMSDKTVRASILESTTQGYQVDTEPSSAFLSRSCGFAGCDEAYLVTLGVHHDPGANAMSWVIAAKVTMNIYYRTKVELVKTLNIYGE